MAENLADAVTSFDADAFRDAIKSINREKEKASEYVSAAGAATKAAIDAQNLDKTALTYTAKLARKEPAEQAAVAAATVTYMDAMGFFDQGSLLEGGSAIEAMRRIVAAHDDGGQSAPSSTVAAIRQATAH